MAATSAQQHNRCTIDPTRIIVISTPNVEWFTTESIAEFAMKNIVRDGRREDLPKLWRDLLFPVPIFVINDPSHDSPEGLPFNPAELLDDNKIRSHFYEAYKKFSDKNYDIVQTQDQDTSVVVTMRAGAEQIATAYYNKAIMQPDLLCSVGFVMVSIDDYMPDNPDSREVAFDFPALPDEVDSLELCPNGATEKALLEIAHSAISIIDHDYAPLYGFKHSSLGCATMKSHTGFTIVICAYHCNKQYTLGDLLRDQIYDEYYSHTCDGVVYI